MSSRLDRTIDVANDLQYKDDKGKKKLHNLHKSFSDLLDWLHAQQPLNFLPKWVRTARLT